MPSLWLEDPFAGVLSTILVATVPSALERNVLVIEPLRDLTVAFPYNIWTRALISLSLLRRSNLILCYVGGDCPHVQHSSSIDLFGKTTLARGKETSLKSHRA